MKRNERPVFAKNLIKAREANGWSQLKAADLLNVSRSAYGAYEEGRAQPGLSTFPTICQVFAINNVISFLENPDFNWYNQQVEYVITIDSLLEQRYASASKREQDIVDTVLKIGAKD